MSSKVNKKKHYFSPSARSKESDLRARISKALMSVQTDMGNIESKVSAFEKRLEEILSRLDDLESRLKKLEDLLD